MAQKIHELFEQRIDEEEAPEYEEIGVINVARLVGSRRIPDTRTYRPDELPNAEAVGQLFGSGEYILVARRLNEGPNGERAGSIYRKNHGLIVGAEHGPWKRMLDGPPQPAPSSGNAAPAAAHTNGTANVFAGAPGMPPAEAMGSPWLMMMWMQQMAMQREAEQRREQIERDRIAQERHEAEARRQHELTLAMIQGSQKSDASGVPQIVASVADTFAKIHAPAPPPVAAPAAPAPTLKQQLEDAIALKKFSKELGGDDDVELIKAVGQGLGGLAGLGSLFGGGGGGLTGAPAT